ncbi:uncharacterized protein LOC123872924 [Maniola jurtina]|uniref:uncharacterized protein LOC123872924 n=1 Tax=Maniola jurtina TaxID=191418 RepID=UPI001E68D13A|nr:uncharacterized protein LOC123872924 [Maniola jurtina]XP_045773481.1 uncharacterized protein LOC123872924 [Maniola jurtina]XP_045773483.1 uncharacterized protein LOC123872924 [Maniola jurtina]XP_045773484.1 uncharacterized protein LOC123872924 [Maniola jurtina]
MCYNGKCMHCISIETGSLIFAIISIILSGLGILFIIGALVYINIVLATSTHPETSEELRMVVVASLTTNVVLGVALCLILVPFAFTIVLIKGLVEKKSGLVKVYFVYSVVSKSLLLFSVVMGLVAGSYPPEHAITILLIGGVYGLILRMIYLTYKKLEVDGQYKQSRLIEEKY